MTANAKIKVIKKADIQRQSEPQGKARSAKEAARDIVSTVTNWVSDLEQRKRNETKAAFENLFVQQPATSRS